MKRFVSLDFLRGVAIIGVLFFHLLQVVWNYEAVLTGGIEWYYWGIVIFLVFFAQFNVLFVTLSGMVNTISIDKQWKRFMTQNPSNDQKRLMANKILKSQVVRGVFILIMAYVYGFILEDVFLNFIKQSPDPILASLHALYSSNILHAIGWGVLISGVIYTQFLRRDKSREWISKYFILIAVVMLVLTPFMITLSRAFPYFWDGWQTRALIWNVIYFPINSIFRGTCPLFPFAIFGVVGAMIGYRIAKGNIEKPYAKRWFVGSVVTFVAGFFLVLLKIAGLDAMLNLEANSLLYYFINSVYEVGSDLMVLGGSVLLMLILIYTMDVQGRMSWYAKRTIPIRRFGLVALTVFVLQWVVLVPLLMAYNGITNAITGSATPFLQGNFAAGIYFFDFAYAPGLTAWEFMFWALITIVVWGVLLWLWGKAGFKGSFEWLLIKLMKKGRKDADERLKMSSSLYNVESIVENPESYWGCGRVIALWIIFVLMAVVNTAMLALLLL